MKMVQLVYFGSDDGPDVTLSIYLTTDRYMTYLYLHENPKPQEYCALRIRCGLSAKEIEHIKSALEKTLYSICIQDQGKLIGMGRIVGDLGTTVQIVDIAVDPDYQGQKLGNMIMKNIMTYIKKNVPETCFVNLFADVDFLYQKFGFVVPNNTVGMILDRDKLK